MNFDTKIDTKGFKAGTNTIKTQANGLKSTIASLGKTMIAVFGVAQLIKFGKQAVETASDLQEVQNVVDTAFGSMANKMEEFAKTSIETFGISKLASKRTGSTFMAMASGMGIVQDNASDMAIALTGLSADMSSFYNVTQDVASIALKSIFTGETETLKQFGIVMTEANLQAFALSQGVKKKVSAMSQSEKVMLRYNYVMQQTSLAQGDFAKTSDSWANQTRVLSEKWKEFLGILGNGLIQVLTPVVKFLSTALTYLTQFATQVGAILSSVFNLNNATGSTAKNTAAIAGSAADASTGLSDMGDAAEKASKKTNETAGFDKLNNMTEGIADNAGNAADSLLMMGNGSGGEYGFSVTPSVTPPDTTALETGLRTAIENIKLGFTEFTTWLSTNFGPIFSGIWTNLQPEIETFKTTFSGIFTDIQSLGQPFLDYFSSSFTPFLQQYFTTVGTIVTGLFDTFNQVFSDIWNIAVYPMIQKFVSDVLPTVTEFGTQFLQLLEDVFEGVKEIFDMIWRDAIAPALEIAVGIWTDFVEILSEFWDKWGEPIFDNLKDAWQTTSDLFVSLWENYLEPIWSTFMEVVDELWTEHLEPLLANFMDLIGEFVNGALEIYNKFIAPIVEWFVEYLGPPISEIVSWLIEVIGGFLGGVIDVVNGIITALKGVIQFITGVLTGDWEKAWEGIKNIFGGIWDALVNIVKTPINLIIDLINGLVGGIVKGVNAVIKAINSISFKVPDWIPGIGGKKVGFNIGEITAPKIPKLATGTVIPPNSEFMAILGDQKKGVNIEAPLDTIVDAFKKVTGQNGNGNGTEVHLHVYEDGRVRYETVVKYEKENYNKTGKSVFVH